MKVSVFKRLESSIFAFRRTVGNLQDAFIVINYDLHWNPVRLIQRIGRLDRIGALADTVYVHNFLL